MVLKINNSKLYSQTYNSYEEASLRYYDINNNDNDNNLLTNNDKYQLDIVYNIRNTIPVIICVIQLLSMLLAPYMAIIIISYSIFYMLLKLNCFNTWINTNFDIFSNKNPIIIVLTSLLVIITIFNIIAYYIITPSSFITGDKGLNSMGVSTKPGLYYKKLKGLSRIEKLLIKCPLITSSEITNGILKYCYHYYLSFDNNNNNNNNNNNKDVNNFKQKSFKPTPWLFSGDIRTLLPFLLFKPPDAKYIRRWVRVPLCSGPREKISNDDGISPYEAIALDYAEPITMIESKNKIYLLIIAGLTGGSREGYVQDLVHAATTMGYGCYVMLGRGLGDDNKCYSMAGFHGARTSDVEVCSKLLKKSVLNKGDKLFIVGISMGGILCANAIGRGLLKKDDVDGAIAISPCFDTIKNINFWWSRRLWQPLLASGLKDAFASKKNHLEKLQRNLGSNKKIKDVLTTIVDVFDFDSMLVPPMHSFRDVYHYYSDMSCNESALLSSQIVEKEKKKQIACKDSLPVPLLVIHAIDDPIIHADTLPCHSGVAETVDNIAVLVTNQGGHVGWPLGLNPSKNRWLLQNNLILEFIAAAASE